MDHPQAADLSRMNVTPESESKTLEELTVMLAHLQAKWQGGADKMSTEEKKKHHDTLMGVLQMVNTMQNDLKKSMDDSGHEGMVLQMRGKSGYAFIPSADEIQAAFVARNQRVVFGAEVNVKLVSVEENFNYVKAGLKSPNYLLKEKEIYVKFESAEQASRVLRIGDYLHVKINANQQAPFQFFAPRQSTTIRATYRTIGDLIIRLREVDQQLKSLGAIPGRGGVPELSGMLVQNDEFDRGVAGYTKDARGYDKATLHNFLCTRVRVDKRKRQSSLDQLVDERIDILLKLTKYDPDEFPFTFEREFK